MLSAEQEYVVENIDEHNLVVALPGSGKTHTLKYAIDNLLSLNENYKVLVVTFTNAAMSEMNERIKGHVTHDKLPRIEVSTFHQIMLKMARTLDNKKLVIGGKQTSYVFRAMSHSQTRFKFEDAKNIIEKYGRMRTYDAVDITSNEWSLFQAYQEILHNNNEKDFNVITNQVVDALETGELKYLDYTHILVDEAQDIDEAQLHWLILHGKAGAKITAVGDDDQAIYGFRGAAGYQNLVDLQHELSSQCLILTICRRCSPKILATGEKLISFNRDRINKTMTSSKTDNDGVFEFKPYDSKENEIEGVISELKKSYLGWGVLARNNLILDDLEVELIKAEIPYQRLSGKGFFDIWQVTMLLNMIKAISYNKAYNELKHSLGYLGEDEETILAIDGMVKQIGYISELSQYYDPQWMHVTRDFLQICTKHSLDTTNDHDIRNRVSELYEFIHQNKVAISQHDDEPRSKDAAYMDTLGSIILNLKGSYLTRLKTLADNLDKVKEKVAINREVVSLSTLHSSKGLEWPNVWIMGFDEGIIPSNEGIENIKIREEERRLAYVGITRAEDRLIISSKGNKSSFIGEIEA